MSKLLSLSNSNSKNTSYNANGSKENKNSREITKKTNKSVNKSKGGEISSGNGSIESNNNNNTNNNNSNSNNTYSNSNNTYSNSNSNSLSNNNNQANNNNKGQYSKNSITAKRKKFYDKLMKKTNKKDLSNDKQMKNNLNKVFDSDDFDAMKNVPNNQSTSSNIKITNNTNIIVNVKSGTKSLDIRALNNNNNNDIMMRDMRELHIITKKAICSISNINPLLDTLDNYNELNERRNYSNNKVFNKKPMNELLINDNTDNNDYSINQLLINNLTIDKKYNCLNNPNININFNNNKPSSSQIINIININGGNYSMDQTKKSFIKNIPKTDLSSIKECTYDAQYMTKPQNLQKKNIKFQQYEIDNNSIKQYKNKVNKINKLPNKKYSHNNWHGNTINVFSSKADNNNNSNRSKNKIVKKYIEHLRNTNKTICSNAIKKNTFLDINKSKMK